WTHKGTVANPFDIPGGKLRDQPVARYPRQPDQCAQYSREDNRQRRDPKGVEKADRKSPQVSVPGVIGKQRGLADFEAGFTRQKTKAAGNPTCRKVFHRVGNKVPSGEAARGRQ